MRLTSSSARAHAIVGRALELATCGEEVVMDELLALADRRREPLELAREQLQLKLYRCPDDARAGRALRHVLRALDATT